jgi:mRNA-degrading endonuclease toxin of MazEF toxin-antitoxin module
MKESKLQKSSKAQCQKIRTISKERINSKKIGELNLKMMAKIKESIILHLELC